MAKNPLIEKILKTSTSKFTAVMSESTMFNERDNIPTELPILNIALSGKLNGGLGSGLTMIAGPSKHFKSLLGLFLVKAYMKQYPESVCLFFDSEFGTPMTYLDSFGIDSSRVVHCPIMHIEQLKFDLSAQLDALERGDKVIVFIDSVGNLASKKEVEDSLNQNTAADMTRAKQLKSLWRIATPYFRTKDIPCIAINHSYETQEMFSKTVVSGGCLVAGTKIIDHTGVAKNVEDYIVGDMVITMDGIKEVSATWNPDTLLDGEPECYEIEFDDGSTVVCSDSHKFLNGSNEWIEAKDIKAGDSFYSI